MRMGMSLGMGQHLSQRLTQKLVTSLPPMNWSLLDAFNDEGDSPLQFQKVQLDVSAMSLEERLQAVDKVNEVFRFAYTRAQNEDGEKKGRCYKIPLMRDRNVEIEDIKIPISKEAYEQAIAIVKGAGRFQRIARAVPYFQLYTDVKEYIESRGSSLDEVLIIGVDRGGRLPSFVMREALGKQESYTLKVNQASGSDGELDREKLEEFIEKGILMNKCVLFVDSTVDSGRQIDVLTRYFDSEEGKTRIGHKDWCIVGSNEDGENLYRHKNINWGLNPDESFEDRPELMGVDYAEGSYTKVIDTPSETSKAIKQALLEVPRGVILDFSNLESFFDSGKANGEIKRILRSNTWRRADDSREALDISEREEHSFREDFKRKKLLVIGNGSEITLREEEMKYIAKSLAFCYDTFAGTLWGNPGEVLERFSQQREGSAQLYQPLSSRKNFTDLVYGSKVHFHGETKEAFREHLVQSTDAVLVLGGNEGTLRETVLSLYVKKPVFLVNHGRVADYFSRVKNSQKYPHLYRYSLSETVQKLQEFSLL